MQTLVQLLPPAEMGTAHMERSMETATLTEDQVLLVLRRIRKYAAEYQQEHSSSCDKALAEAVRLLELETC